MKMLRSSLVALSLCLGAYAGGAQADINFSFEFDFIVGPLTGTTATGHFAVSEADCAGLVCTGEFTPAGPNHLTSLQIVIDGTTFTAADDSGFPTFPAFTLANSVLTNIDFLDDLVAPFLTFENFQLAGSTLVGAGVFDNGNPGGPSLFTEVTQVGGAVPEPGTALLLGAGLLAGMGLSRRRNGKQAA